AFRSAGRPIRGLHPGQTRKETAMTVGQVGFDGSNPQIRPQDDLFGHVNGTWLETVEIPPDLPMTGGFIDLVLEAEAQVDEILRESAADAAAGTAEVGTPRQQIGDLYTSFLDESGVEGRAAEPLADLLDAVASSTDLTSLAATIGRLARVGVDGPFGVY